MAQGQGAGLNEVRFGARITREDGDSCPRGQFDPEERERGRRRRQDIGAQDAEVGRLTEGDVAGEDWWHWCGGRCLGPDVGPAPSADEGQAQDDEQGETWVTTHSATLLSRTSHHRRGRPWIIAAIDLPRRTHPARNALRRRGILSAD